MSAVICRYDYVTQQIPVIGCYYYHLLAYSLILTKARPVALMFMGGYTYSFIRMDFKELVCVYMTQVER